MLEDMNLEKGSDIQYHDVQSSNRLSRLLAYFRLIYAAKFAASGTRWCPNNISALLECITIVQSRYLLCSRKDYLLNMNLIMKGCDCIHVQLQRDKRQNHTARSIRADMNPMISSIPLTFWSLS